MENICLTHGSNFRAVIAVAWMMLLTPLKSWGADLLTNGTQFTVDNITYCCYDNSTTIPSVTVIGASAAAATDGVVTIPETVVYGDKTCNVNQVGYWRSGTWDAAITGVSYAAPDKIKTLAYNAFKGATFTTLEIPSGVTKVIPQALAGADMLQEITVSSGNTTYTAQDGILYANSGKTLVYMPQAWKGLENTSSFAVPEGVEEIANFAFCNPSFNGHSIYQMSLPASLKTLHFEDDSRSFGWTGIQDITVAEGNTTFSAKDGFLLNKAGDKLIYVCTFRFGKEEYRNGGTLKIPDGVTTVGRHAAVGLWGDNPGYTTLDLNQVKTLEEDAFIDNQKLTKVIFGADATDIEGGLKNNVNVSEYVVDEGNSLYHTVDGIVYSKDMTKLLFCPPTKTGEVTIPEGVTTVTDYAFNNSKIEKVAFPSTMQTVGVSFQNCENLTTVNFGNSLVTELKKGTFSGSGLAEVTVPAKMTDMGEGFKDCGSLRVVRIPDGSQLKAISSGAFTGTALEEVVFQGACPNMTIIGSQAFSNLTTLKQVLNIPATIELLDYACFNGCTSLDSVSFAMDADHKSALRTIHMYVFQNTAIEYIDLPDGVDNIYQGAFAHSKLRTITLPNPDNKYYQGVNPRAFEACNDLQDIFVKPGNPQYASVAGMLIAKKTDGNGNKGRLVIFPAGKANDKFLLIPPTVTEIGDYAFYDAQKLTNLTLTNQVTRIGKRSFGLCPNLKTITILSKAFIPGTTIHQTTNEESFDNGTNNTDHYNAYTSTKLYVRKEFIDKDGRADNNYLTDSFWKQFNVIATSGTVSHDGDNTAVDEFMPVVENTSTNGTQGTVDLIAANADANVKTYLVPSIVSLSDLKVYTLSSDGTSRTETTVTGTFDVSLIGDEAFASAPENINEVVVRYQPGYIGYKAFLNASSSIKQVIFTADKPAEKMAYAYFDLATTFDNTAESYGKEFTSEQKIYVKKSKLADYKTAWATYKDQIDYKIPDTKISNKYGTFAREFDVDFKDYYANASDPARVVAFTAGVWGKGTGDYGDKTEYHVSMTSIPNGDGFYVPACTGVLLKVTNQDKKATPSDFYYCIGEQDGETSLEGSNVMVGNTVSTKSVSGEGIYMMQGGQFHPLGTQTVSAFPAHKAYLQLANVPAGAKIIFDTEEVTTGITSLDNGASPSSAYYNLRGIRVSHPHKGVYITNGRKVVFK